MAAGSVPEGAQALAEGIRRDIALGLCAVGIIMAEADHQQITGADMLGNVVQPPSSRKVLLLRPAMAQLSMTRPGSS